MQDRFESPFEEFTKNAMLIAHNKERTIAQQRQDYENLVHAIAFRSKELFLDKLDKEGILPKDRDILKL